MQKMFWIDMEMTGLDFEHCVILEVAAVVTDLDLKTLEEYSATVRRSQECLRSMDPWCVQTHGKSGLSAEVPSGQPIDVVEKALLDLAKRHFAGEKIILCGNCVQTDKRFVEKEMPTFAKLLHYRVVDVSSWKEVFFSRYGTVFEKRDLHRARSDIFESIAELGHYLTFINAPRRGSSSQYP